MKVLTIHEVQDNMLNLDLSEFDILTFDDGLYSQYKNYEHFLKFNKPMYFFISTGIVCPEETFQNQEVVTSEIAHEHYFDYGDFTNYMKWSQIKEISERPNCFIGGHGHSHVTLKYAPIDVQASMTSNETLIMIEEFKRHGIEINSFCFPYNFAAIGWRHYLKKVGIDKFFGQERTDIRELL